MGQNEVKRNSKGLVRQSKSQFLYMLLEDLELGDEQKLQRCFTSLRAKG